MNKEKIDVEVVEEVDEFFEFPVAQSKPGEIICDFTVFKEKIRNRVEECKSMVLTENNYKQIADTKAGINKTIKMLKDYSTKLKKKYLEPYELYEKQVKDCLFLMEEAKISLETQINSFDDEIEHKKAEDIKKEFEKICSNNNFEYVKIEQIWNPKWTNKTYKPKDILKDINNAIDAINNALDILSNFDDSPMLVAEFLEKLTFDNLQGNTLLNSIISSYNIRKQKIEELRKTSTRISKPEELTSEKPVVNLNTDFKYNFTLKIQNATQQQCLELSKFLKDNHYTYELRMEN